MMADFLTGCGIKLSSIVSYNHLGNNDGKNLNESHTFKSKEISKSGCVDDAIVSNKALYPNKYVKIERFFMLRLHHVPGDHGSPVCPKRIAPCGFCNF